MRFGALGQVLTSTVLVQSLALVQIIQKSASFVFASNVFDILAGSRREAFRTSPLACDPLTYICWTISEFGSVRFAEGKELHTFAIDEKDLFKIDGHFSLFPLERVSERIHVLPSEAATYAQDRQVFPTDQPFDPAAHRVLFGSSRAACISATLEPLVIY